MPIKVRIPTPLQRLTGGAAEVEADGTTVREVLDSLEQKCAGIKERICESNGEIRRFVNIFLNDEDVRFLGGLDTKLKDGDELSIIPAIAGGASA